MHFRLASAALAALLTGICATVRAEAPAPTPINSFDDAVGLWTGSVWFTSSVSLSVAPNGVVTFSGPHSVTQKAVIKNERLVVQSSSTDLDCGIMNTKLTCHARFGSWYAELNLTKKP